MTGARGLLAAAMIVASAMPAAAQTLTVAYN